MVGSIKNLNPQISSSILSVSPGKDLSATANINKVPSFKTVNFIDREAIFKSSPQICMAMGTCNGEKFLAEQLQSIENQTHKNWRLVISDDGSSANALAIAKPYQQKWGIDRLEMRQVAAARVLPKLSVNGVRNGISVPSPGFKL